MCGEDSASAGDRAVGRPAATATRFLLRLRQAAEISRSDEEAQPVNILANRCGLLCLFVTYLTDGGHYAPIPWLLTISQESCPRATKMKIP